MTGRYRTELIGGVVIEAISTDLHRHVSTALATARAGQLVRIRQGDIPMYVLDFQARANRIHIVSRVVRRAKSHTIHPSTAPDWPDWMTEAHRIIDGINQSQEESCPTP